MALRYRVQIWNNFSSTTHPWIWNVKASNGRIICTSGEGFTSRAMAYKSVSKFLQMATELRVALPPKSPPQPMKGESTMKC